ncbi:MAG: DUF6502 family protein [Gallionellaceae bacterium]|nr:DUF6502 family protein [Gallionellaceae bacterium]
MNKGQVNQLTPHPALMQAVQRLLRPLARLLMAFGMDFPAFSGLAKGVFVDVAARDFPSDGTAITDSRVSLLSGVHRREVKRLRAEMQQHLPPLTVSLGAQIVARWCAEGRYLDPRRRPAPLPRLASQGGEISFEHLVAGVNKDIRPRAVLDEWLRLGVARLDEEDRVHLSEAAFVPAKGLEEKAFYFGKNVGDHLSAGVHNLLDQQPPFLERCVYYDGLSETSVETLRALSRELAVTALQEVNRQALALQQNDAERIGSKVRITFGTYFYAETENMARKDAETER